MRCSKAKPRPPTKKYIATNSNRRISKVLPLGSGITANKRLFANGKLAATKAAKITNQTDAVCDTSGAKHLHDGLCTQRHQATGQYAQYQHQQTIDGQHHAHVR